MYAYVDADDANHSAARRLLEEHDGPVLMPVLVVTEVTYLLTTRLGSRAEILFLGDIASGALSPVEVEPPDWLRIAELVARYADLPFGTVDASVVAAAERLGIVTVATFDRRDFGVVRPRHVDALELVP